MRCYDCRFIQRLHLGVAVLKAVFEGLGPLAWRHSTRLAKLAKSVALAKPLSWKLAVGARFWLRTDLFFSFSGQMPWFLPLPRAGEAHRLAMAGVGRRCGGTEATLSDADAGAGRPSGPTNTPHELARERGRESQ